MRIYFQEKPWDLYLAFSFTVVTSLLLFATRFESPLTIASVIFVPGYVLVAVLFPGNREIDWIERGVMSIGLSLAVVPLLGFVLNFTPLGIFPLEVYTAVTLCTLLLGLAAYYRRMILPTEERLSFSLNVSMKHGIPNSLVDKTLNIVLASGVVLAAGALAYVIFVPRNGEQFTEFFVYGPGGNASGYARCLNVSQPATIILGVVNHESRSVNYTVNLDLVGVRLQYNQTAGVNETIEVNRTVLSSFNVILANGQNWTHPVTFNIDAAGLWKVQLLLFNESLVLPPYRELHFFVKVPCI